MAFIVQKTVLEPLCRAQNNDVQLALLHAKKGRRLASGAGGYNLLGDNPNARPDRWPQFLSSSALVFSPIVGTMTQIFLGMTKIQQAFATVGNYLNFQTDFPVG